MAGPPAKAGESEPEPPVIASIDPAPQSDWSLWSGLALTVVALLAGLLIVPLRDPDGPSSLRTFVALTAVLCGGTAFALLSLFKGRTGTSLAVYYGSLMCMAAVVVLGLLSVMIGQAVEISALWIIFIILLAADCILLMFVARMHPADDLLVRCSMRCAIPGAVASVLASLGAVAGMSIFARFSALLSVLIFTPVVTLLIAVPIDTPKGSPGLYAAMVIAGASALGSSASPLWSADLEVGLIPLRLSVRVACLR